MKTILKFIGLKVAEIGGATLIIYYIGKLGMVLSGLKIYNWLSDGEPANSWGLGLLYGILTILLLLMGACIMAGFVTLIRANWKLANKKWTKK